MHGSESANISKTKRYWMAYEEDYLRRMYPSMLAKDIARELDRSYLSVKNVIKRLGLRKGKEWNARRNSEVLALWGTGLYTRKQLLAETGLSDGQVTAIFAKHKPRIRRKTVHGLMKEMFAIGKSVDDIAEHFQYSRGRVVQILGTTRRNAVRVCPTCKKEFTGPALKQYCSKICITKGCQEEKTCVVCGEIFRAMNKGALTCSGTCHKSLKQLRPLLRDMDVRQRYKAGESIGDLVLEFDLTQATIYRMVKGRNLFVFDIERYVRNARIKGRSGFAQTEMMRARKNLERLKVWFYIKNNIIKRVKAV